jgi:hypothetical protein
MGVCGQDGHATLEHQLCSLLLDGDDVPEQVFEPFFRQHSTGFFSAIPFPNRRFFFLVHFSTNTAPPASGVGGGEGSGFQVEETRDYRLDSTRD